MRSSGIGGFVVVAFAFADRDGHLVRYLCRHPGDDKRNVHLQAHGAERNEGEIYFGQTQPIMNVRPDLQVAMNVAQAVVDGVLVGHTVTAVRSVHGGEIAATYEIAFVEDEPPVILKVYPDSLHWKMQKEVAVISLVQGRLSVPAPRILLADDSKRLLDLNFVLMTKLPGATLGSLESALAGDRGVSAYRQIGRLLREFHRIPMEAFGYIGADGIVMAHGTNHNYLSHQCDRKLKEFTDQGGSAELARRIAAYFSTRMQMLHECSHPVLCHNDLHAGNVLAEITDQGVRLSGVLDFEGALAGDPLMDLAKALFYLNVEERNAVLEGYGDTGRRQCSPTLQFYHLYFVLELWCWMAQIGNAQQLHALALDLERHSAA
jgi:aminoglycoside phosphotransferase (APT) family kinase protein